MSCHSGIPVQSRGVPPLDPPVDVVPPVEEPPPVDVVPPVEEPPVEGPSMIVEPPVEVEPPPPVEVKPPEPAPVEPPVDVEPPEELLLLVEELFCPPRDEPPSPASVN